jgi:hypothetical protein
MRFVGGDNALLRQELDAARDHEDSENESEEVDKEALTRLAFKRHRIL